MRSIVVFMSMKYYISFPLQFFLTFIPSKKNSVVQKAESYAVYKDQCRRFIVLHVHSFIQILVCTAVKMPFRTQPQQPLKYLFRKKRRYCHGIFPENDAIAWSALITITQPSSVKPEMDVAVYRVQ